MRALTGSIFFAISLITASPAGAGSLCHAPEELSGKIKSCRQNKVFAEAAGICVDRIDAASKLQQAMVAQAFALNGSSSAQAQSARLENNQTNITGAVSALEGLELQAIAAKGTLEAYGGQFAYPGGISSQEAKSLGLQKMFEKYSCFEGNKAAVQSKVEQMKERIHEFGAAKKEAKAIEARTGAAVLRLQDSAPARARGAIPTETGGRVSAPPEAKDMDFGGMFSGELEPSRSDISGTKPDSKR
jgi:hypothetical protein